MNDAAQYQTNMELLVAQGGLVFELLELDKMLATVERADAVGFMVDPSAYQAALRDGRLEHQRAILRAAITFRNACRKAIDADPTGGAP